MKFGTSLAAVALFALTLGGMPARADDCDDVIEQIEDVVQVASKIMQTRMAEVTKTANEATDDKAKDANKKTYCSAAGEFLGISRAYRAVVSECMRGNKRRDTVASVDKSIKQLEDAMRPNCE